jgi:hypothetical protein
MEQTVLQVLLAHEVLLAQLARDQLEPLVLQVVQVLQDHKVQLDYKEQQVQLALKVQLDLDQLVLLGI